jgi:hypothetical protein
LHDSLSDLHAGGRYESGERITWRYAAKNLELMAGAFLFMFLAAMILPGLATPVLGMAESIAAPVSSLHPAKIGPAAKPKG